MNMKKLIESIDKLSAGKTLNESTNVTDFNPPSQGGTRKELLAKLRKTKDPKDATKARKAGATQKELQDAMKGVEESYIFNGPFPFDVDHMHGGRGINLPKAETKKYFTDKKQWERAVDDINSSKYDDNSDYIGVTGRSTVEINGREWARWSDAQQKGYIELSSMSEQGVAEGMNVFEDDQVRPQGKILKSLRDMAIASPTLTFQNFRRAGKESIITDAIMAAKVLKRYYQQKGNQAAVQFLYNLENELNDFRNGYNSSTDNLDLSDLARGTLGKMQFQTNEGVAEGSNRLKSTTDIEAIQALSDQALMRYYKEFKNLYRIDDSREVKNSIIALKNEMKRRDSAGSVEGLGEGYFDKDEEDNQLQMDANRKGRLNREREPSGSEKIDARLRAQNDQLAQYNQSGKFWLKQKDTQEHLSDSFDGKQAANAAAVALLKQRPELKGNLVITAYGPGETQGVAEAAKWRDPKYQGQTFAYDDSYEGPGDTRAGKVSLDRAGMRQLPGQTFDPLEYKAREKQATGKLTPQDVKYATAKNFGKEKQQQLDYDRSEGVAEGKGPLGQGNLALALDTLKGSWSGWNQVKSTDPDIEVYDYDDGEGGYETTGTIQHNLDTGEITIDYSGGYGEDPVEGTFHSIGDAMNALRGGYSGSHGGKAPNYDTLASRTLAGPDDLRKTDRAGKKGTLSKSRMDQMKASSAHRMRGGPKGVLPEGSDDKEPFDYDEWKASTVKPRKPRGHKDAEALGKAIDREQSELRKRKEQGVAEGIPDVDHMPGPIIKRTQTGCKRCHGKGFVYKTPDGETHPMNRPDAKKYKCGKCNGIGFVKLAEQSVSESKATRQPKQLKKSNKR